MTSLNPDQLYNSERILNAFLCHDYITASDRAVQMNVLVDSQGIDKYCEQNLSELAVVVKGQLMFPACDELDNAILDYSLFVCLFAREVA